MEFLDHLKLGTKALIPLIIMALLIVGLVGLGATQLSQLQHQSAEIIEHIDPAILYSAEANKAAQQIGYDVYRTLSYASGTPEEDEAQKDFGRWVSLGDKLMDQAATAYPEKAGDFAKFKTRLDVIVAELQAQQSIAVKTNGFALGSKDTPGDMDLGASVIRTQLPIDSQLRDLSNDITGYSDQLIIQDKQASQALSVASAKAIWTMIMLGALSIVGGLSAAIWMTSVNVSKPIARLADRMKTLAGGDLGVEVDGQQRRDEIGLMAKAVQVFKDNGLKANALETEANRLRLEADAERGNSEAERRRVEAEQATVVRILADNLSRLA